MARTLKFTVGVAMSPLEHYVPIAQKAEELGYDAIAVPDSIFYSEDVGAPYPYTTDGERMWGAQTPWADPLVGAMAMAQATSTIRFYTSVVKMGVRNAVLFARQVNTVAAMSGNRFGLGLGLGWLPEEFQWCGQSYAGRGARVDEDIEVLRKILGGGMVEHHGRFHDFGKLQMSPTLTAPVPIYIGGHTEPALRRAARVADGWASAMIMFDDLVTTVARLGELRREEGRDQLPFEVQVSVLDRFGADGYREQEAAGVTDVITIPWLYYGVGFDGPLQAKLDGMERFHADHMAPLEDDA